MGGEGRGRPCSKSFEALVAKILGKYLNFAFLHKLPCGCPKWADKKITSGISKIEGEGASFGQCPKEKRFFSDVIPNTNKYLVLQQK